MSLQDTLRTQLTPELFDQVVDSLGDNFNYDLIPRSRLNKVIRERDTAREQLENSPPQGQATPPASAPTTPPATPQTPDVDVEALNASWQTKMDEAIQGVKIQFATLEKLKEANAIDAELIFKAGLLDTASFKMDATGNVTGIDEAIAALKESRGVLFTQTTPKGTGKVGGNNGGDGGTVTTKEQFMALPLDQQMSFKTANPEVFKSFLNS